MEEEEFSEARVNLEMYCKDLEYTVDYTVDYCSWCQDEEIVKGKMKKHFE